MSDNNNNKLVLETFLPYRLSYLTNIISRNLAHLYSKQYNIAPAEWKVMANLTRHPDTSAAEVGEKTAMDKVAVSRAVTTLCNRGLVHKTFAKEDRRRSVLNLTKKGLETYHQIEPLVINFENYLKQALSEEERVHLDRLLDKLTDHASSHRVDDA